MPQRRPAGIYRKRVAAGQRIAGTRTADDKAADIMLDAIETWMAGRKAQ